MKNLQLFSYYFKREITTRYLGNITGILWVFVQPIITLLIYWVVFGVIFKQRVPEAKEIGFIVYLAIGFWPWMAFSESILRSITTVSDNDDLIGKINLDFKIPVIATISGIFLINIIGYILVILFLVLFASKFNYSGIPLLIFPLLQLYIFSVAIGLLLSSIQIFVKDTLQFFSTIITLWFFLTPIIYSESSLPENFKAIIQFNPVYTPITFIHTALITNRPLDWQNMFLLTVFIVTLLYFSVKVFNKLSPRFVDFK